MPVGATPPFKPSVAAGTENNNAGSYSPLGIDITRSDSEQEITGFSSVLSPGLTANLNGVPFCSEAQIALARSKSGAQEETEPSCPVASRIRHTLVGVGVGVGSVLAYSPGRLYMAGPFEGAPFSVVSITSAKVGPFDLRTVIVHLPLNIDPLTAQVTIPAGAADQIPHIFKGIVVHVRDIRAYVDRASFTKTPPTAPRCRSGRARSAPDRTSRAHPMTCRRPLPTASKPPTARTSRSNRPSRSRPQANEQSRRC